MAIRWALGEDWAWALLSPSEQAEYAIRYRYLRDAIDALNLITIASDYTLEVIQKSPNGIDGAEGINCGTIDNLNGYTLRITCRPGYEHKGDLYGGCRLNLSSKNVFGLYEPPTIGFASTSTTAGTIEVDNLVLGKTSAYSPSEIERMAIEFADYAGGATPAKNLIMHDCIIIPGTPSQLPIDSSGLRVQGGSSGGYTRLYNCRISGFSIPINAAEDCHILELAGGQSGDKTLCQAWGVVVDSQEINPNGTYSAKKGNIYGGSNWTIKNCSAIRHYGNSAWNLTGTPIVSNCASDDSSLVTGTSNVVIDVGTAYKSLDKTSTDYLKPMAAGALDGAATTYPAFAPNDIAWITRSTPGAIGPYEVPTDPGPLKHVEYAIDLDTGTAVTDASLAIDSGVIRMVTGRPEYDGVAPYPKWEDMTSNTDTWYEGFIVKDGLGTATRSIDVTRTGGYGTMSGFTFKVRNDGMLWESLLANEIYVSGKVVNLYAVISGVFYRVWSGVVDRTAYTESSFSFICRPDYRQTHVTIPIEAVSDVAFVDAPEDSIGKLIPICIGELPYARVTAVEDEEEPAPLVLNDNGFFYATSAYEYYDGDLADTPPYDIVAPYILLRTNGIPYTEGELADGTFYMRVTRGLGAGGADSADLDAMVQITANGASYADGGRDWNYVTKFTLADRISNLEANKTTALQYVDGSYNVVAPTINTWYFTVTKMTFNHIVSNGEIYEFKKDQYNRSQLWYYNSGSKKFSDQTTLVKEVDATTANDFGHPSMQLDKSRVQAGGDITMYTYHSPVIIDYKATVDQGKVELSGYNGTGFVYDKPSIISLLTDRKATTYIKALTDEVIDNSVIPPAPRVPSRLTVTFTIKVPDELIDSDIKDIYLVPNAEIESYYNGVDVRYTSRLFLRDAFGNVIRDDMGNDLTIDYESSNTESNSINIAPDEYSRNGGISDDVASTWWKFSDKCKIDDYVITSIVKGYGVQTFDVELMIDVVGTFILRPTMYIKELVFVASKNVNISKGDLYTRVTGELVQTATPTNNVYDAFRHMVLNYDGRDAGDLDFGDSTDGGVAGRRNDWTVGRQLTDSQTTKEYSDELAQHSFVVIFQARSGKLTYKAWLEDFRTPLQHDESVILHDSLRHVGKSQPSDVFNDFLVKYQYNQATGEYDRSYFITKLSEATFPESTGSWTEYVGGLPQTAYAEAKALWEICRETYIRTGIINRLPEESSELPWFVDRLLYDATQTYNVGVNSAAFMYLKNCVEWLAREREVVEYELAINATNVTMELAHPVNFSDTILTNGVDRIGTISSIQIDPTEDRILVEATLFPDDGITIDGDIIESGSQADTITESGSEADTITEDGA